MRLSVLPLLAGLALATPAFADGRPALKPLRYAEDWRPLCDATARERTLDALKCLRLSPSTTLSLGGEARWRAEWADNPGFGFDGLGDDDVLMQRLLLHGDLRMGDSARVFVQAGDWQATGRAFGAPPTDENRLDLAQGFIDLSMNVAESRATLRAGRQEITFGSGRLASTREGPNIRRSFDGALVELARDGWRLDAFATRPVALEPGSFDDSADRSGAFYGLYASAIPLPAGQVDLYWLGYEEADARFAQGRANERRQSLGARFFGDRGRLDWDVEIVWQFGDFGEADIRAWTIASDLGVSFPGAPWSPRLGLKADVASGDDNPSDGTLRTFNALYPKFPYFSEANIVAPANIMDVQPGVTVSPSDRLTLTASYNALWKHERADAFYVPPLVPIPGTAGGDRWIGWQVSLGAAWEPVEGLSVGVSYVRFEPSDTHAEAGAARGEFVLSQLALRF